MKATFSEDDRRVRHLSLTQYHDRNDPEKKTRVSLKEEEVERLLEFARTISNCELLSAGTYKFEGETRDKSVTEGEARRLFDSYPDLFARLIENAPLAEDVVAVGYRRAQLEKFERLLTSPEAFQAERDRLDCGPESVWQRFFEANRWIFGYGLSYQFISGLEGRKLEEVVRGWSLAGAGIRADGFLKTRGAFGSLCFVEIKHHGTKLLADTPYRSASWQPHSELTGGVAQIHATVYTAMEEYRGRNDLKKEGGDPRGEVLYNFAPRSFLVIGSLDQFKSAHGAALLRKPVGFPS